MLFYISYLSDDILKKLATTDLGYRAQILWPERSTLYEDTTVLWKADRNKMN